MATTTQYCFICGKGCPLSNPQCRKGMRKALNMKAKQAGREDHDEAWGEYYDDYSQHDFGYDPEGLADPDAHNYPEGHVPVQRPVIRQRNWDLDSDEDFLDL